jgi:hypothetical protein
MGAVKRRVQTDGAAGDYFDHRLISWRLKRWLWDGAKCVCSLRRDVLQKHVGVNVKS